MLIYASSWFKLEPLILKATLISIKYLIITSCYFLWVQITMTISDQM